MSTCARAPVPFFSEGTHMSRKTSQSPGSRPRTRRRNWTQMKPATYLRAQLGELHEDIAAARDAGSWQAVARLRSEAQKLRAALDEARALERAANPRNITPEEHLANRAEDAAMSEDAELEPYVSEWMRRHKIVIEDFHDFLRSRLHAIDGGIDG